ncbi:prepilin-type N-terminal cleavage/methylation domain-containing protein [Patescibacteria group bacterium]|nr:prepilin-type N-terminal cleavage/methylation domain-containing protein [Patescibacteria group bacterium]
MKKGFTIIELMVTVAIIAILAALIMVSFSNIKAKNRDAKRMGDLKSISNALNLYYSVNNSFPTCLACPAGVYLNNNPIDAVSTKLKDGNFIPAPIIDPLNSGDYQYNYQSANGTDYTLTFYLETNSIKGYSAGINTMKP